MLNLLRLMGVREFPWTTFLIAVVLGVVAGLLTKVVYWGNTSGGSTVLVYLGFVGALVGGFLGLCYHIIVEHCWLGLQ